MYVYMHVHVYVCKSKLHEECVYLLVTVTGTPTAVVLERISLTSIRLRTFDVPLDSPAVSGQYAYLTSPEANDTSSLDFAAGKMRIFEINNEEVGDILQFRLVAVSDEERTLPSAISEPFSLDFCE